MFEDFNRQSGKYQRYLIYPVGPNEKVDLGDLSHGDLLTLAYRGRSGWFNYQTTCEGWKNRIKWVRKPPSWPDCEDETRLTRKELTPNQPRNS
jgi:hypothetical protein